MTDQPSAPPDTRRIDRSINVARGLIILLAVLPLMPFLYVVIFSGEIEAASNQTQLFERLRDYTYGLVVASCLLLPIVAVAGLNMTFRKRAVAQTAARGRIFLGGLVIWVVYAFLVIAFFILFYAAPRVSP